MINQHLQSFIQSLDFKHHMMDKKIANENKRPMPDYLILKALKKQKLKIKESIKLHLA